MSRSCEKGQSGFQDSKRLDPEALRRSSPKPWTGTSSTCCFCLLTLLKCCLSAWTHIDSCCSCNNQTKLHHWQDADPFEMTNDRPENNEIWEILKFLSSMHQVSQNRNSLILLLPNVVFSCQGRLKQKGSINGFMLKVTTEIFTFTYFTSLGIEFSAIGLVLDKTKN